jgi:hypothetical protein
MSRENRRIVNKCARLQEFDTVLTETGYTSIQKPQAMTLLAADNHQRAFACS